ncbi:HIRAN domain-containing protein [Lysinibacillus sp. NPDC059133]|uniref:HIRAN domain-containing protein n=1 Tax=Lysinibacillus sp. NPDC059133 TaxID=3346737 RepID=UPI0036BD6906
MNKHQSLWLVWQNAETRLFYHIGTLSFTNNQYEFYYTWQSASGQKVKDALENGYMLHPSFPDLQKCYKANELFAAFDRRLPSEKRADFTQIISELHLSAAPSKMELLEQTRGKLATDTYSFEKPLKVENDKLVTAFFVHGMRHQQDLPTNWADIVKMTNRVYLQAEPENPVDKNAIAIYAGMGTKLGFVPRFYATGISALLKRGLQPTIQVDTINDKSTPDWWLKVELKSNFNELSPEELKQLDPLFEYVI